jgi:hypothetical protein
MVNQLRNKEQTIKSKLEKQKEEGLRELTLHPPRETIRLSDVNKPEGSGVLPDRDLKRNLGCG